MASSDRLISKADKLIQSGKYKDAKFKLQDYLLENPKDEKVLWKLVEVYMMNNDPVNSVKTLRKILNYNSGSKYSIIDFIRDKLVKKFPKSSEVIQFQFELEFQNKDYKSLYYTLKKLNEDKLKIIRDKYKNKLKMLKKINDVDFILNNNIDLYYKLFFTNFVLENYNKAFDYIEVILNKNIKPEMNLILEFLKIFQNIENDNPFLNYYIGRILVKNEKYNNAIKEFIRGIEENRSLYEYITKIFDSINIDYDTYPNIYKLKALGNYYNENYKKSVENFILFFEKSDKEINFNFIKENLTDIYLNLGPKNFVITALVQLLVYEKKYDEAYRKFIQIKNPQSKKVKELGQILLEKNQESERIYKVLADYHKNNKNYKKQFHLLKKIYELNNDNSDYIIDQLTEIDKENYDLKQYYTLLGSAYLTISNIKKAYLLFKEFEASFPDLTEKIIDNYENLLKHSPGSIKLQKLLFNMYFENNYNKKALKILGKLIINDNKLYYDELYLKLNELGNNAPELLDNVISLLNIFKKKKLRKEYINYNEAYLLFLKSADPVMIFQKINKSLKNSTDEQLVENSEKLAKKILEDNPNNLDLKWKYVDILFDNQYYDRIIENVKSIYINYQGEYLNILTYLKKLTDKGLINDEIINLYNEIAIEKSEYNKLQKFIDSIKEKNPDSTAILISEIYLNYEKNEFKKLIKSLNNLLERNNNKSLKIIKNIIDEISIIVKPNPGLNYILGSYYLEIEEYKTGLDIFEKVIGKEEKYTNLMIDKIQKLSELKGDSPRILILIGDIFKELNKDRKAITHYNRAIQIDRTIADTLHPKYEKIYKRNDADEFIIFELARLYIYLEKLDEAYMLLEEIQIKQDNVLKYIKLLKMMINENEDFWKGYKLLADQYLDNHKITSAIENYNKIFNKLDNNFLNSLKEKVERYLKDKTNNKLKLFYTKILINLNSNLDLIIENINDVMKFNDPSMNAELIQILDSANELHENEIILKLLIDLHMSIRNYDEIFTIIKENINVFENKEHIFESFDFLIKNSEKKEEIFIYYINLLKKMEKFSKIDEILEKTNFNKFLNENKQKELLLFHANLKKINNDMESYGIIIKNLLSILNSKNQLIKLREKLNYDENSIWVDYLKSHENEKNLVKLANIYLEGNKMKKAEDLLFGSSFKKIVNSTTRKYLFLKYYYKKNDISSFMTILQSYNFDSFNIDNQDIKLLKYIINICKKKKMFNKAFFYLHFLKGNINDYEYKKILNLIEKEKENYITINKFNMK